MASKNTKNWLGWHFACRGGQLRYDDDRKPHKGETLTTPLYGGQATRRTVPKLCRFGFHASKDIMDALYWAPRKAAYIARVRLGGRLVHDTSKSVGMERTAISGYVNIRKELRQFTAWCRGRHGKGGSVDPCCAHGALQAASHARDRAQSYGWQNLTLNKKAAQRERRAQSKYLEKLVRAAIKRATRPARPAGRQGKEART